MLNHHARPSQCQLCVPHEHTDPSSGITTYAHETECPNHPHQEN